MAESAIIPADGLIWSTPAGSGRVDLHLRIQTEAGPMIAVVHLDRDEAHKHARGVLAASGDAFERTFGSEACRG